METKFEDLARHFIEDRFGTGAAQSDVEELAGIIKQAVENYLEELGK